MLKKEPHPDDFMTVTLSLELRAKPNPHSSDPRPFDTTGIHLVMAANDATECLEKVVAAIRERRLYGFMVQDAAESHVGAGEIEETVDDLISEASARQERESNNQEKTNGTDTQLDG